MYMPLKALSIRQTIRSGDFVKVRTLPRKSVTVIGISCFWIADAGANNRKMLNTSSVKSTMNVFILSFIIVKK